MYNFGWTNVDCVRGHFVYCVNGVRRFISPLHESQFVASCVEYGDEFVLIGYVG